jgi:hypothetical protein
MQNLWTLGFEPRAFSRSHDHDGELHRSLSFKCLYLRPILEGSIEVFRFSWPLARI